MTNKKQKPEPQETEKSIESSEGKFDLNWLLNPSQAPGAKAESSGDLDDLISGKANQIAPSQPGEEFERHNLRFLRCLQPNSEFDLTGDTLFALESSNREDQRPVLYFENPLITVPMDKITFFNETSRKWVGARTLWPYMADGSNAYNKAQKPIALCKSEDGINPLAWFWGREMPVVNPRTQLPVKIGFHYKGTVGGKPQYEPMLGESICAQCPLGQWTDGKQPVCKEGWKWVVFLAPQKAIQYNPHAKNRADREVEVDFPGETIIFSGAGAVLRALQGAKEGTNGAQKNGKALPGIDEFGKELPTKRRIWVEALNAKKRQMMYCVGVADEPEDVRIRYFEQMKRVNSESLQERMNTTELAIERHPDQVRWLVCDVPTYPYAPDGLVEDTMDKRVPVFYLQVTKVASAFTNNPLVPLIGVSDVQMEEQDYLLWLQAQADYINRDVHSLIARTDNAEALQKRMAQSQPLQMITPPVNRPALPPKTSDLDDADIGYPDEDVTVEGEYEEVGDTEEDTPFD